MANPKSKAYSLACPSPFRDRVNRLALRRGVSVADLARAVLLLVPGSWLDRIADPGEPDAVDRETVSLKSGPASGRSLRRKPRLQLRLEPGHDKPRLRRALALALALDEGSLSLRLEAGDGSRATPAEPSKAETPLKHLIEQVAFQPLANGVTTREAALYVLGFPPAARPEVLELKSRFRALAQILHPDSPTGDHRRMSQLNQAIALLTKR